MESALIAVLQSVGGGDAIAMAGIVVLFLRMRRVEQVITTKLENGINKGLRE